MVLLISEIQIAGVNLIDYIGDIIVISVSENHIRNSLKLIYIADYAAVEKVILFHSGFVNHNLNALGLNALHNTLDRALAEVITA